MNAPAAHRHLIDRAAAAPLWAQVQADVTRRLDAGEFERGFPGEKQLVTEYGVSRHTVREALRSLRESGVIEGGRGRQSRVASREISQPQGTLYSLFASVEAAGHRQRSAVRRLEARADAVVAARLGLEGSAPLIYLERLRMLDDEPFATDRVWLPAQVAAPLLGVDFTQTSLYGQLAERCGVILTGGRESVRAVVPSYGERRLLELPSDVAALSIERVGEVRGQPVEFRHTVVRGDRFAFTTDLTTPDRIAVSLADRPVRTKENP